MKTIRSLLLVLAAALSLTAAAQSQQVILKFHTVVKEMTSNNTFHFMVGASQATWIDIDCGFGTQEQEVQQAVYDGSSSSVKATTVSCTVSDAGWVTVYGDDPQYIDYLDLEGCYIDVIEFPLLTNLAILNLDHNQLGAIDLEGKNSLESLSLNDNPFGRKPLMLPASLPRLTILAMSMAGAVDPLFDIKGYPALASFEGYSSGISHLDPTQCPELLRLTLDLNPIASIDVTHNPKLLILNTSETRITQLDLSQNPYLTELYCAHVGSLNNSFKLTALDVTHNPELQRFYCDGNLLQELDISRNTKLVSLGCSRNQLPGISFDNNPALYNVDIKLNNMDFVTIPADRETFSEYYYSQREFPVDKSYPVGRELDFSSRVNRPGSTTNAILVAVDESNPEDVTALDESYYTWDNGKLTLLKATADSVYVGFLNSELTDAMLTTGKFVVKEVEDYGKNIAAVQVKFSSSSSYKQLAMGVGILGASPTALKTFWVDFGDGDLKEYTATGELLGENMEITGDRAGATTTIYIADGDELTAFGCNKGRILGSDFTNARSMRQLKINGVGLSKIDLQWNRSLQILDLSGNNLTAVDLDGVNGSYGKNVLGDINLSNNKIATLRLNDNAAIHHLDLSGNKLTEIMLLRAANIRTMNLARNLLTAVSLSDCESLEELDLSGNLLTELAVPAYLPLTKLDITGNDFTFNTLPATGKVADYKYAPQRDIQLPAKAPAVNLNGYWRTAGGTTTYTWYTSPGNTVVDEGNITGTEGRFQFKDATVGNIYCVLSHPAFPDFTGDNILKTTVVAAADKPTHVFCSFHTTEASKGHLVLTGTMANEVVYIDWTGNGDLEQYPMKTVYTEFPVNSLADRDVKCYSYDELDNVSLFSLRGVKLSCIDASPMTQLSMFACSGASLPDGGLKLPASPGIAELDLGGNELTTVDIKGYDHLDFLVLTSNPIACLDLTKLTYLGNLAAANCVITDVKFNSPRLWNVDLQGNLLESVDLAGAPSIEQLWLSNNRLTSLDVSALERLRVLMVDGNNLTFNELPAVDSKYIIYNYTNQRPLQVDVVDGTVDLSAHHMVRDVETEYKWFIDTPYVDEEGNVSGEDLYENEEYTIDKGVTTFLKPFNHIMCVMHNSHFPGLHQMTEFINVEAAGIEDVTVGATASPAVYFNLQGIKVDNPVKGNVYIRRTGNHSAKVRL